jgi:PAS domain S-box-containing protein
MEKPGWKILLVEDSEDDYILTRSYLSDVKSGQFKLTWAKNMAEGLRALDEMALDLILVDYNLPGDSGLEFVQAARQHGCRIPVILLTGMASYALDVEAMKAGVSDFLEKSQINGPLLERAIRYAIERQQTQTRLEQLNIELKRAKASLEQRVAERTIELQKSHNALREANALNERIFSTIHLGIVYLDRDFNFIRVNRNYAVACGYPEDFFPGKNHFDLYPDAENESIFRTVVETGESYLAIAKPFVFPDRPEKGTTYWDWSLQPITEENGSVSGLIFSLFDVTEQERIRQALRASEERLKAVVNGAPLILWSTDHDGNVNLIEGRGLARLGVTSEEVVGQNLEKYINDQPEVVAAIQKALAGEETTLILPPTSRSGEILEVHYSPLYDDHGKIAGVSGLSIFITERVKAERHAQQAAARLAAQAELSRLFDEAHLDAHLVVDILARRTAELIGDACVVTRISDDGQLVMPVAFHHANPKAEAVLSGVLFGSSSPVGEGYAGQVAQTGEPVLVPEVTQRRTKNLSNQGPFIERYGVHSVLIVPMKVQDRVIGTLGVTRDRPGNPYTPEDRVFLEGLASRAALAIANAALYETVQKELAERQRVEAELSEIQTRLLDGVESERMALARELHDGPIQDLYGVTFQLRMQGELLPEESRAGVTELEKSIQHIVSSLRATSVELRPPALTKFGLVPTIRSHCDAFLKTQPGLQVQLELMPDQRDESTPVLSERARLAMFRIYQVALTNIGRHAHATQASVQLSYDDQFVTMQIEDNGVGFHVRRWLELARQGHLGLVGAKERAEALGGTFELNSIPGKGTTVRVQIPRDA